MATFLGIQEELLDLLEQSNQKLDEVLCFPTYQVQNPDDIQFHVLQWLYEFSIPPNPLEWAFPMPLRIQHQKKITAQDPYFLIDGTSHQWIFPILDESSKLQKHLHLLKPSIFKQTTFDIGNMFSLWESLLDPHQTKQQLPFVTQGWLSKKSLDWQFGLDWKWIGKKPLLFQVTIEAKDPKLFLSYIDFIRNSLDTKVESFIGIGHTSQWNPMGKKAQRIQAQCEAISFAQLDWDNSSLQEIWIETKDGGGIHIQKNPQQAFEIKRIQMD